MAEDDDRESKRPGRRPSLFPSAGDDDLSAPLPSHRPSLFPAAPDGDEGSELPSYRPSLVPSVRTPGEDDREGVRLSLRPSLMPAPIPQPEAELEREVRPSRRPSMLPAGAASITIGNLRLGIPHVLPDELFTTLTAGRGVRVERIVSRGHRSDDGFWYDQDEDEFVMVVSGHARVEVEQQGELDLRAGDYLVLPAHVKHRVTWTEPQQDTVWLAVFYSAE